MIEYTLNRKKVKNINLRVKRDGSVVVSANPKVPVEYINKFVSSKEEWIIKSIEKFREIEDKRRVEKGKIQILGEIYKLEDISIGEDKIDKWIREKARLEFHQSIKRMLPLLKEYNIKAPTFKIRKMKTRWGSCIKNKNSITLNMELIKYPREVIDYVVLHELVHFVHFDHSKNFYNLLEGLMPDWKERRESL
ncbi:M48 family metallopeptidase [Clostridium sp. MSJ-11]|uniref:M48 family metallopeptidase n=1 Tax=Clostridium mobile TaxID=2841512 RepID=A0ABS6EK00_9CLOT|nr:SprT family zinc-dependent metalloprotease [Clostridium mobile]MBU5484734.1 M48 family metallopeptidase [Clostridium mobile]